MTFSRLALLSVTLLAGCATPPLGPLVTVLPGPDKSYPQFTADDARCRAEADYRVAGQAQYANNRGLGAGVLTTVAGTALGAIVGGGSGAAVGAVTGAGVGLGIGASTSGSAQPALQAQYDNVYAQCMYIAGNQLPGAPPLVVYRVVPASPYGY